MVTLAPDSGGSGTYDNRNVVIDYWEGQQMREFSDIVRIAMERLKRWVTGFAHLLYSEELVMRTSLTSIIIFLFCNTAIYANDLRLGNSNIFVELGDYATGGCWTNLREVRNYAEGSMENFGARIQNQPWQGLADERHYRFMISVTGGRLYADGSGPCAAAIAIRIDGLTTINGVPAFAVFEEAGYFKAENDNLNRTVLDIISMFVREKPLKY